MRSSDLCKDIISVEEYSEEIVKPINKIDKTSILFEKNNLNWNKKSTLMKSRENEFMVKKINNITKHIDPVSKYQDLTDNKITNKLRKLYQNLNTSKPNTIVSSRQNTIHNNMPNTSRKLISSKSNEKDFFMILLNNYQTKHKGIKTIANRVDQIVNKENSQRKSLETKTKLSSFITTKKLFNIDKNKSINDSEIKSQEHYKNYNRISNSKFLCNPINKKYQTFYEDIQRNVIGSSLEKKQFERRKKDFSNNIINL